MTYPCRFRHHFLFVTWLAVVLSIGVTADLVVDLVFEAQAVEAAATGTPTSEEVEDSAEHLLLPTQLDGQTTSPLFVSQVVSDALALSPDDGSLLSTTLGRDPPLLHSLLIPSHPQSSPFVLRI